MKKKFTAAFLTLAALGTLATLAPSAQAWWKREYVGDIIGCGGMGACSHSLIPVHDTSSHPKYNLKTLNVETFRTGTATVSAKVCRQIWASDSIVCSSTLTSSSGTGHYALHLGSRLHVWTADNFSDFGYVSVSSNAGYQPAQVNGMYITD